MTDGEKAALKVRIEAANRTMGSLTDAVGNFLVHAFHKLALFVIGAATVWAAVRAFLEMGEKGKASIEDLLLLFIYLEIGAMVGIYFKTNHMPVRFLIYVGITVLTRHLIDIVNVRPESDWSVVMLAGAILILALAVAILRFASFHYPMDTERPGGGGSPGESR